MRTSYEYERNNTKRQVKNKRHGLHRLPSARKGTAARKKDANPVRLAANNVVGLNGVQAGKNAMRERSLSRTEDESEEGMVRRASMS